MRLLLAAAVLVAWTVPAGSSLGDQAAGSRASRPSRAREAAESSSASGLRGGALPRRRGGDWAPAGDARGDPGQAWAATLLWAGSAGVPLRGGALGRSGASRMEGGGCLGLRGGQYQQAARKKEIDGTDTICPWNPEPLRQLGEDINNDPDWYPDSKWDSDMADVPDIQYTGDGAPANQGGGQAESVAPCIPREQLPFEYVNNEEPHDHKDPADEMCMWCDPVWKRDVKLLTAAREGDYEAVLTSIDKGANIRARDVMYMNWTALHYAAYYGHATIVESLADFGANMDAQDWLMWTPLHYAAFKGRYDSCLALLNCGANVSVLTEKGKTALQKAVYLQHVECIELLCEWMGLDPQLHIFETNMTKEDKEEALDLDAHENDRIFDKLHKEGDAEDLASSPEASQEGEERKKKPNVMDFSVEGDSDYDGVNADGPARTKEQEANRKEILEEYDRRFRAIRNRDRE